MSSKPLSFAGAATVEASSKPEEPARLHHEDAAAMEAVSEAAADSCMPHWLAFLRLPAAVWRQLTVNQPRSCEASIAGVNIRSGSGAVPTQARLRCALQWG